MLKNLYIKNVALIPKLDVTFGAGLNILSGETGAGKSIILDSLGFALGDKADVTLIRQGEENLSAEAVFDTAGAGGLGAVLEECGVEREEGDTLLSLRRTLNRQGKSEIFINGRQTPLSVLKRISAYLVDIYGQSEHSQLLKPSEQLNAVDAFLKETAPAKKDAAESFAEYKNIVKELNSMGGGEGERERILDLLSFQIKEINDAALSPAEEEELTRTRTRIVNAERILTSLNGALERLDGEGGAYDALSAAAVTLRAAAGVDKTARELQERIEGAAAETGDIAATLKGMAGEFVYDEKTADKIENRLEDYKRIKRKYGADIPAVKKFLEKITAEHDKYTRSEELIRELNKRLADAVKKLYERSAALSLLRRKAASALEREIAKELAEVGLSGAEFKVRFEDMPQAGEEAKFSANGFDKVEFLFSANKGEDVLPLHKIISGGEMSRFMLAVKSVTARGEGAPVMVFDEIDAGISGKMAEKVAVKLAKIGKDNQALAITHLPQIAAAGDVNFLIEKSFADGKTTTSLKSLTAKQKIAEVARLSGAVDGSQNAAKHAEELILWAKNMKIM